MVEKIMKLNNKITELNVQYDVLEGEKSALQTNEEETSKKKWEQVSELS